MQTTDDNFTPKIRLKLLVLTIFSFITLILAALLVIMLSLQSFTGFASTAPLVLGTCSSTYYSTKYNQINKILITVFITSVASIFLQIAISILVFTPLIIKTVPTQTRIGMTYILTSIHMLSIVIGFSKFLAFHVDLNSMGSACTITYSQILITIILAITSADMLTSLIQYISLLAATYEIHIGSKEELTETYKEVFNLTNNTLENIQDPAKNIHATKKTQKQQPYRLVEAESKVQNVMKEAERYQRYESNNEMAVKAPKFQVQREFPILPDYNPTSQVFESGESFKSIIRHEKLALGKIGNNPGQIAANANIQESDKAYRSKGYLSYIRKMNQNQINQSSNKQSELIATIRGKYSK